MPQVQVGVALTYTAIAAVPLCYLPSLPNIFGGQFQLMYGCFQCTTDLQHPRSTSSQLKLCILGEMPTPTVNRSQHLTTKLTAFINGQHDHGGHL